MLFERLGVDDGSDYEYSQADDPGELVLDAKAVPAVRPKPLPAMPSTRTAEATRFADGIFIWPFPSLVSKQTQLAAVSWCASSVR